MSSVTFSIATETDEADIRRLLSENPMGGTWRISFEREPYGFGGPHFADERQTFVLARCKDTGMAVGLCERVTRPAFVDGTIKHLPYLAALRVAESHRRRIAILKGGFATLRNNPSRADECPYALTSIAVGNNQARRVLTAGIKGLPRYRSVGGLVTMMMRTKRTEVSRRIQIATAENLPEIAAFLVEVLRCRQFAPVVCIDTLLKQSGLSFLVLKEACSISGIIAVWDQRATRQTIIRDLPRHVRPIRQVANLLSPVLGLPRIPAPGQAIDQAYLAFLSTRADDTETSEALVQAGMGAAYEQGLSVATIGVPQNDPLRRALKKRWRAIEYPTELFLVHWPEGEESVASLSSRSAFPEIALL